MPRDLEVKQRIDEARQMVATKHVGGFMTYDQRDVWDTALLLTLMEIRDELRRPR